jgi:hypothetical protein
MRPGRVIALVMGCLLALPALGMLLGGSALGLAYAFARDDDGYFEMSLDDVETVTVAVAAEDVDLAADPGSPDFLIDWLDADVRLQVAALDTDAELFVGIAPADELDAYLAGVAHDEITEVDGNDPVYERRGGLDEIAPPTEQDFWTVSTVGTGDQEIVWEAESGRWGAVVMNADGSPGVAAAVDVGIKAGFVLPLALILLGVGAFLLIAAVILIVVGATGRPDSTEPRAAATSPFDPTPAEAVELRTPEPVSLSATLDPNLSRWQWLVKWFLAIPHFIVLFFLWAGFVVTTIISGFAILFTGRYPRGIFDFNVGVMRWTFRVSHYATTGGLGTDRYPAFSLDARPDDPVHLEVAYPERLSRGLVLVKWWLLAIPHYLIVAILIGGTWGTAGEEVVSVPGLIGVLTIIAGVGLLFTGRYRPSLFGLIIGFNRWVYRVLAYAALMTDSYPPFRLDQGGNEPPAQPLPPPSEPGTGTQAVVQPPPLDRDPARV